MPLPVIVGLVAGVAMMVAGGFRAATGRNARVLKNPDGSMYGGFVRIALGVGILWFVVGAGLTWLITLLF